jgi:hypothetical protein
VTTGFHFEGKNAVAPDGTVFARKFRRGVYSRGSTTIGAFLDANPNTFPNLAPSLLRVMAAVSKNEGRMEAINTWDNSTISFGCFQWTAGVHPAKGELPGLLHHLKRREPEAFNEHFGIFGLDVDFPTGRPTRGRFLLDGQLLRTGPEKERLRTLEWAYHFWQAGHDDRVRRVQIERAAHRVDAFYRVPYIALGRRTVADYVTSEYGVALLLDQHVNRPGHVPKTLARAVAETSGTLGEPETWGSGEEGVLLDHYLELRHRTSMTHSRERGDRTRLAVTQGLASDARGSFIT